MREKHVYRTVKHKDLTRSHVILVNARTKLPNLLSDTSEKLEQICRISNETSEITNHIPEKLNETSVHFSDTHKTLSDTFKVTNYILNFFPSSTYIK